MTWNMTSVVTEVELTFAVLGPALTRSASSTRVGAADRGRLARDLALPGGYSGGAYSRGWTTILDRLAAAVTGRQS